MNEFNEADYADIPLNDDYSGNVAAAPAQNEEQGTVIVKEFEQIDADLAENFVKAALDLICASPEPNGIIKIETISKFKNSLIEVTDETKKRSRKARITLVLQ